VKGQLTKAFGTTGKRTSSPPRRRPAPRSSAPKDFKVRYTRARHQQGRADLKDTTLDVAVTEWRTASYPWNDSSRRDFQIRVQKAIHDGAPVIITWDVDFNAMESGSVPSRARSTSRRSRTPAARAARAVT
jgi:hypothetical protein